MVVVVVLLPANVFAWQETAPPILRVGGPAAAGESTPVPRVLSPQSAQPISPDAAQRSEPATVLIEDNSPPKASVRIVPQRRAATTAEPAETSAKPSTNEPTVEAALLKGVQPGVTTMAQVRAQWGEPERNDRYSQHIEHRYKMEPFQQVVVAFQQNVVTTIVVNLQSPLKPDMVTAQLELDDLEPAFVYDPTGKLLGQVFPERGVMFSYQPGAREPLVAQIVLEGIQPQPFALRAESRLGTHWTQGLKDAEQAVTLDPKFARGHWLKAQLLTVSGKSEEALQAAEEAVRLEGSNAEYRLTRARLYHTRGESAHAVSEAKAALAQAASPLVKARALCFLADLAPVGSVRDYAAAVKLRQESMAQIEPLLASSSTNGNLMAAAREVMLEAQLGTAHDIAWGPWNSKSEVVPQWLGEAQELAKEDKPSPVVARDRQLRVARAALAALAGMQGEVDPTAWVETLEAATPATVAATNDPLRRGQLHWEFSLASYNAMQIYHARGEGLRALRASTKAEESLAQCNQLRGANAEHNYLLGRVYFRTGAVHAVLKRSHAQAISWYNRALPLMQEVPKEILDAGKHGEALVSMGVSFWEVGQRDKALELTSQGLTHMQTAVGQGTMEEVSLTVPYSNLAQMHRRMGDAQTAGKFAQMASRSQGSIK